MATKKVAMQHNFYTRNGGYVGGSVEVAGEIVGNADFFNALTGTGILPWVVITLQNSDNILFTGSRALYNALVTKKYISETVTESAFGSIEG